ncbi:MAG: tetratricopeptide repeat protein [Candidatus Palauibacterales bacterium]|nr:tetratricopeptide repeat protein [Candidatus Palauibacterales bacterium]
MRELVRKLQERHVPRTAVLYLGAGWVALEFIGFVVDNYGFQRTILDASLLLIAIGFPISLIIGWYHGAGGRQSVTRMEASLVGTLLVVALVGTGLILARDHPEARSPELAPAGILPGDLGAGSLAVLPLANSSGADSLDWLGPGLADMLTTNLAQFADLRVVSAQRLLDLMRQAGRQETDVIPEDQALRIAAQSGARTLVRGSFMAAGDEVRLNVQLIDLADGTVTAAETAHGTDVFALVDDVSARLSRRLLGESFTPTELTPVARLATSNLDAYRAYQEGLLAERRFLNEQAREGYARAVQLDSTFAIAWLRLGTQANTSQEALRAFANADRFKENATERDRYMIEAMFAANLQGDLATAERLLQELISRYPEEKDARYQLGVFLDGQGHTDEGRAVLEQAVALDPFFTPAINHLAYIAGRTGDTVAADTLSLRYLELERGQANPHDSRGEILEMIGRNEEARDEFREALRLEPSFLPAYQHLVRSYLHDDDPEGARRAIQPFMDVADPEASVLLRQLEADTYAAEGRYVDAGDAFRRAADRAAQLGRADLRIPPVLEAAEMDLFTRRFDRAEAAYGEADELDPLNGGVLFGLIMVMGAQGRDADMRAVRDTAAVRFGEAPAIIRTRAEAAELLADAHIAWFRDDPRAAVELFDETRELIGTPRPVPIGGAGLETMALIDVGRASEALALAENLERLGSVGNRMDPFQIQAALYLEGRAFEALGQPDQAIRRYERLLELAGPGLTDLLYLGDAPERLRALRSGSTGDRPGN